jgi:hypothetical protein
MVPHHELPGVTDLYQLDVVHHRRSGPVFVQRRTYCGVEQTVETGQLGLPTRSHTPGNLSDGMRAAGYGRATRSNGIISHRRAIFFLLYKSALNQRTAQTVGLFSSHRPGRESPWRVARLARRARHAGRPHVHGRDALDELAVSLEIIASISVNWN